MRPIIALGLLWASAPAAAFEAYLGLGKGLNDALIQSGNIASSESAELGASLASPHDWSLLGPSDLNLRLELAAARLAGRHQGRTDQLEIYALRPVLRWQAGERWHLDLGLGLAHLSDDSHETVRMAKGDNFSIVAGLGFKLDPRRRWALAARYNHYSNGYTAHPNPGLDYASLNLSREF